MDEYRIGIGVLMWEDHKHLEISGSIPTCPENIIRDCIEIIHYVLKRVSENGGKR